MVLNNMAELIAKLLQYGDEYPYIFTFPNAERSEDWGDSFKEGIIELPQLDGGYFFNDGLSTKNIKTITSRFNLYDNCLYQNFINNAPAYGIPHNSLNKTAWVKYFKDYMYRTVYGDRFTGGLKKLYVMMEDGSIRWTWAKAIEIPYRRNITDDPYSLPISIDFTIPDPYFYEIEGEALFKYEVDLIKRIVKCGDSLNYISGEVVNKDSVIEVDNSTCSEVFILVNQPENIGYVEDPCAIEGPCAFNPCLAYLGDFIFPFGDGTLDICITGSAGAKRPYISFRNGWINPTFTNIATGESLTYNGVLNNGDYLEIDLGSANTGESEDLTINTNIVGFDYNDLVFTEIDYVNFMIGNNTITVAGMVDASSIFTINYINKYHN